MKRRNSIFLAVISTLILALFVFVIYYEGSSISGRGFSTRKGDITVIEYGVSNYPFYWADNPQTIQTIVELKQPTLSKLKSSSYAIDAARVIAMGASLGNTLDGAYVNGLSLSVMSPTEFFAVISEKLVAK